MAGPGGGARGGGFSGGGGRSGGGFSSGGRGGFGGGHGHHHHHHHHHGGWFFYPRRYYGGYYGGGCLGGLLGLFLAPIILILVATVLFFSFVGSAFESVSNGGSVVYNEEKFEDYANEEYLRHFSSFDGTEDNLLIVFLVDENYEQFSCIAWVGDNLKTSVSDMFGAEGTKFGNAVLSSINNTSYKYSLSANLAAVMEKMSDNVSALGLSSPFKDPETKSNLPTSKLVNKTALSMNEKTVNDALRDFTEATAIPAVITVDTMENVFGRTLFTFDIVLVILSVGLVILAIFFIVRSIKEARLAKKNGGNQKNGGRDDNMFDNRDFR